MSRSALRKTPVPASQPTGSSSRNPPHPHTLLEPASTSVAAAVRELHSYVDEFPITLLNNNRKTELKRFIVHLEKLIVSDATPPSGQPDPPPPQGPDRSSLQIDLNILQQSINALQGSLKDIVKSSVQEALDGAPSLKARAQPPTPVARPARDSPKHLEVTIGTPPSARGEALAKLSASQLKSEVDAALDASEIVGLKGSRVQGVRRLHNGCLLVRASSQEQADLLLRHDGTWLPHLQSLKGARIERKSFLLIAASVPMDFNPVAPNAAESLWLENSGTVPSKGAIHDLRWLHAGRSGAVKREGSLVFSVSDAAIADFLIYSSLSVRGALCPVSKFTPPPMQCYRCQAFGHTAKACPHAASPSSLRCARCAGPHALRECICPAKTKCSDGRHCAHIQVQCANCGGPHKSFDSKCPVKAQEQSMIAARFNNGSCYYNPGFRPHLPPRALSAVAAQ